MESLSELFNPITKSTYLVKDGKMQGIKKPCKNRWQDKSLECIKKLKDGEKFKGSIFRCYKLDERRAEMSLRDCEELGKPFARYFLKVYSSINK